MSAFPAVPEIPEQRICARIEGDELVLSVPKGTLTSEVIAKLTSGKPEHLRSLKKLLERVGPDCEEISTIVANDNGKTIVGVVAGIVSHRKCIEARIRNLRSVSCRCIAIVVLDSSDRSSRLLYVGGDQVGSK